MQTFQELIVYAYKYVSLRQRTKYISDRMTQNYNKAKWSCLMLSGTSEFKIYHVTNLYYEYKYKGFMWILFAGVY